MVRDDRLYAPSRGAATYFSQWRQPLGSPVVIRKPRRGDRGASVKRWRVDRSRSPLRLSVVPVCRPSGARAPSRANQWLAPLAKLFRPSGAARHTNELIASAA